MTKRPNILFIFTDQQRHDTIRALGNDVIKTPNIDRLVNEGVAFDNAFTPSPVCVPARCSLIYGQYPDRTGCFDNGPMPEEERETFIHALTSAGYRTHGIGKCHFTPDSLALRGFQTRQTQEEMVSQPENDDYLSHIHRHGYDYMTDPHGVRGDMYYIPQPAQMPAEYHPTQWVGDQAVDFINKQTRKDPWFLYAGFIHPHPPFAPPSPWHKLYKTSDMPAPYVPPEVEALTTYINLYQNRYKYRGWGTDVNLMRTLKAYYYACISFIDFQVGRMLHALEQTDALDNTMIIYTSDHGELLGDYNCVGKRSMHDASARIPFIVRYPAVFPSGTRVVQPVSLVDVAPTVLQVAGTSMGTHKCDGVNLVDLMTGDSGREYVYAQFSHGPTATYMAVSQKWKYVYSAPDDREFLFDRVDDPKEVRNLAGESEFCHQVETMKLSLISHLKESGHTEGIEGDCWRKFPRLNIPEDPNEGLLVQDHRWADTFIEGYSRG